MILPKFILYECVCVCVYIYIYIYTHTHTNACVHMCKHFMQITKITIIIKLIVRNTENFDQIFYVCRIFWNLKLNNEIKLSYNWMYKELKKFVLDHSKLYAVILTKIKIK